MIEEFVKGFLVGLITCFWLGLSAITFAKGVIDRQPVLSILRLAGGFLFFSTFLLRSVS